MPRLPWWVWASGAGVLLVAFLRGKGSPEEEAQEAAQDEEEEMATGTDLPPFPALEVASGKYLAVAAARAFFAMQAVAQKAGVSLPISTAWRSPAWQQRLYDAYKAFLAGGPWAAQAAPPGKSYHEKGIALDLSGLNPKATNYNPTRSAWLNANAAQYGWYNTGKYFKAPEPWHWVYGVQRE